MLIPTPTHAPSTHILSRTRASTFLSPHSRTSKNYPPTLPRTFHAHFPSTFNATMVPSNSSKPLTHAHSTLITSNFLRELAMPTPLKISKHFLCPAPQTFRLLSTHFPKPIPKHFPKPTPNHCPSSQQPKPSPPKNPRTFQELSKNFPRTFQEISKNFPRPFPSPHPPNFLPPSYSLSCLYLSSAYSITYSLGLSLPTPLRLTLNLNKKLESI